MFELMSDERPQLERVEELFKMLQGVIPKGHHIPPGEIPKLTSDQAWTVIWFLGNQYWQVPDFIERCNVCGDLYDSNCEVQLERLINTNFAIYNANARKRAEAFLKTTEKWVE